MSDEENSGIFSRRKDYERRVPVAILPLPTKGLVMIQDVDDILGTLLSAELGKVPGCSIADKSQITFAPPTTVEASPPQTPSLNLYLYDIRENRSVRESGLRITRKPGESTVGVQRPPINLDLSYLVTAHTGSNASLEHRLLSEALTVLLRFQEVPREYLSGAVEDQGIVLAVAQPDHLASTDPPALWQALGGRMRTALSLVATAQYNPYETKWTRVVREMIIGIGVGTPPYGPQRPLDTASIRVSAAGVVLDHAQEKPLPGVTVSVEGYKEETTDDRGFFSLLNLPPGLQTLRFRRNGYRNKEAEVVVPAIGHPENLEPCVVGLEALGDQEWALKAAVQSAETRSLLGAADVGPVYHASLSGLLRREDGHPAAYVRVEASGRQTTTDADGLYCFFDLPPGPHTVTADLPGIWLAETAAAPQSRKSGEKEKKPQ